MFCQVKVKITSQRVLKKRRKICFLDMYLYIVGPYTVWKSIQKIYRTMKDPRNENLYKNGNNFPQKSRTAQGHGFLRKPH